MDKDKIPCIIPGVCGCPLGRKRSYFNLTSQRAGVSFTRAWQKSVYKQQQPKSHLLQPCSFAPLWPYQKVRNMMVLFKGLKRPSQCLPNVSNANREVIALQEMRRELRVITVGVFMSPERGSWRVVSGLSAMPIGVKQTWSTGKLLSSNSFQTCQQFLDAGGISLISG